MLSSILNTRSVTQSAKELGRTQSAVSHSLKKLREILNDELVYRQGNSLELTAKAQAMQLPLKNWLEQLDSILNIGDFDPAKSSRVFYIAATDIIEQLFAPKIISILQKKAPNVQMRFLRWEYPKVESQLLNSQVDFAVGVRGFDTSNIMQKILYEEKFISLVRKGHPILKGKVSLEKFLAYPHVMTGPGDGKGAVDHYLNKLNRKRKLLYTVNSFASAPALIENSDCILTAPLRFTDFLKKKHKVQTFNTPFKMDKFHLKLYWGKKHHNDPMNQWMREVILSVVERGAW